MMAMTIAAANQRLHASQRSARPAPPPEPQQAAAAPASGKPTSGGSVRTAEGKKGEVPDATHKLQKILAAQEKYMRKKKRRRRSAASDSDSSSSDDD
jgi:hypothetical protein